MNPEEIKHEALALPEEQRADLVQKLLLSLDVPSEAEVAQDWLDEAERRAKELDSGLVKRVSADEVMRKARALLR